MAEKPEEQNQNPPAPPAGTPPTGTPPKSSEIVSDNHAKAIRTLEDKLANSEKTTQDLRKELGELQTIVKKAGEVKTPVVPEKPMSVLQYLEELVFSPKTK